MKRFLALLLAVSLAQVHAQDAASGGPQGAADKTKSQIQEHVAQLAKSIEAAKAKLQTASATPAARAAQFDEMIGTIQKAVAEVSDGGETMGLINTALKQNEDKLREYKNKKSDSNISAKTQEVYQRLEEKFKKSNDELYRAKMSVNTRRADLEQALKSAQEQKTLFLDMIQADQLLEAAEAVKALADNMAKVTNSITDMAAELGATPPAKPVTR